MLEVSLNSKFHFLILFLISSLSFGQVFIPFLKGNVAPTVAPLSPIYIIAGSSMQFTAAGGMGVYVWANTGAAQADNALVTSGGATDDVMDYDARDTSYTTDTVTMTSPGYANITRSVVTYDPLSISPTSITLGVTATQTFTGAGGCLNGANCVGGSRVYSVLSGVGAINSASGVYTAPGVAGSAVVQVADSIGNTATANVTVTNSLTISPTPVRVPIYSTAQFSVILGTSPYAFSVFAGTGTVACRSTLTGTHTAAVTTINVTNTTGCPAVGSIVVGTETICYSGLTGTTFTGATRGCNATVAAAYVAGVAYNSTRAVYTAPTMIGSATVRVTDSLAATGDAAVSIIKPVDVKTGQYHACALYDEGSLKCWGYNTNGQLGVGSTATIGDSGIEVGAANAFVDLGTGKTVTKFSTGLLHTCAILNDSTLKCWGNGANGRLGYGNTTSKGTTAASMGNALAVVDLGVGKTATEIYAFGAHTCAILNDGTLKCWGSNAYGQLGYGNTTSYGSAAGQMGNSLPVVDLGVGKTAVKVVGGLDFTCALLNDATVKCWGRNQRGQLGKDSTTVIGTAAGQMGNSLTAVNIGAFTALDIVALYETVCVRRSNNTVVCWGRNNNGAVGINNTAGNNANIGDQAGEMAALASVNMGAGFGTLAKIYSMGRSVCAEDTVNFVKCWGYNAYGQLLLGTTTTAKAPAAAATAMDFGTGLVVSKMAASLDTICALFTNERIKCWGRAQAGAGVLNGVLMNGPVLIHLGDSAGESGNSLPYINH